MITPTEIRKKAKNKYPEILRALVTDEVVFPWLVPSNKTLPKELSAYMQALETLLTKSKNRTGAGYIVELETKQTRSLGSQSVPREIRFDSAEDYLNFLNKAKEASDYIGRVSTLTAFSPKLGEWAIQYPKKVIAAEALEHDQPVWEGILAVLSWFLEDYEADTFYIRELPVAVHTKFVEQHKGLLEELLLLLLPQHHRPQGGSFASLWGLRDKEPLFRLRSLDSSLTLQGFSELALPLSTIGAMTEHPKRVFILENEITYLTFPAVPQAWAVFGSGKAVSRLREVEWLAQTELHYWSDLDAEGFEMLNNLRQSFPHLQSLLMDQATWEAHQPWVVKGSEGKAKPLPYLQPDEQALYQHLAEHNLRLEQERVSVGYQRELLGSGA